jgi:hypothetical protein
MKLVTALAVLCALVRGVLAQQITVGNNVSGWYVKTPQTPGGYTQSPFLSDGLTLDPVAVDWIGKLSPPGGVLRAMDWQNTNGSQIKTPADMVPVNGYNFTDKGGSMEALAELATRTRNNLWVNVPQASAGQWTDPRQSVAYAMGQRLGAKLNPGITKYVMDEYANELWNGGDGNQGTANLIRARQSPLTTPGASDFQKLCEMAWIDWFDNHQAMKQGLGDALQARGLPRNAIELRGAGPGFIANPYVPFYGVTRLKQVRDPAQVDATLANTRLIIAPYLPGAPTDVGGIQPGETAQSFIAKCLQFRDANYPNWFKSNYEMAKSFGMKGLALYETMGGSTYDFDSGTNFLVNFNRGSEIKDFERGFLNYVMDLVDGKLDGKNADPDAPLIIFGSAGIPYSEQFGTWAPKEFYDSPTSPKAQAFLDFIAVSAANVDPGTVPEPSAALVLGVAAGMVAMRRRAA